MCSSLSQSDNAFANSHLMYFWLFIFLFAIKSFHIISLGWDVIKNLENEVSILLTEKRTYFQYFWNALHVFSFNLVALGVLLVHVLLWSWRWFELVSCKVNLMCICKGNQLWFYYIGWSQWIFIVLFFSVCLRYDYV